MNSRMEEGQMAPSPLIRLQPFDKGALLEPFRPAVQAGRILDRRRVALLHSVFRISHCPVFTGDAPASQVKIMSLFSCLAMIASSVCSPFMTSESASVQNTQS